MNKIILKGLLFVLLFTGTLFLSAETPILILFDEANPPFMYGQNRNAEGIYPALVAEAFARIKVNVKLESSAWKRALVGLDNGNNGVGCLYKNSERLLKYDYSKSVFEEKLALYVLKGKEFKYSKISDLFGKNVGVHLGWSYGDEFDKAVVDKKILRNDGNTDLSNLEKLKKGYIDVVIANTEFVDVLLNSKKIEIDLVKLPVLFSSISVYLAFNKSVKKTSLLSNFDEVIDSMRKDGTYDKIVKTEISKQ